MALLAVGMCTNAGAQEAAVGHDHGALTARYVAAVQQAILARWTRPASVVEGQRCRLEVRQLPGGAILSAQASADCEFDAAGRRSIETAVLKAQPLPYAGYEPVFSRYLILNFTARDPAP
ncbi:cell envelope integrity protein TolA [Lysobacter silvisoli]|uniref:cell envelope integrity protein TolA n=1 Tax=Lysobacter silvisoli TaxID=2293254 RepID=UPI001314E15D|nr:TonB C-terminal domain-containing protein [Lysobacter silvisoli]